MKLSATKPITPQMVAEHLRVAMEEYIELMTAAVNGKLIEPESMDLLRKEGYVSIGWSGDPMWNLCHEQVIQNFKDAKWTVRQSTTDKCRYFFHVKENDDAQKA